MLIFLSLLNQKFENNVKSLLFPEIAYVKFQPRTTFDITNLTQSKLNMKGYFICF